MIVFGQTDMGLVRAENQDYYTNKRINDNSLYSIVCDGMGGADGGAVASKLATECIEETLDRELLNENTSYKQALVSAMNNANALVYNKANTDENLSGMGTTAVVAIVENDMLYCVSAGDSRLYRYNLAENRLDQLTQDHTMVAFLLKRGGITPEQAKNHPQKHYITRAIGVDEVLDSDYFEYKIQKDDVILLCTDGLYNFLSPESMKKKIVDSTTLNTVRPLIDTANNNGGGDNITAVIIVPKGGV